VFGVVFGRGHVGLPATLQQVARLVAPRLHTQPSAAGRTAQQMLHDVVNTLHLSAFSGV
jgi:hypothetical protein